MLLDPEAAMGGGWRKEVIHGDSKYGKRQEVNVMRMNDGWTDTITAVYRRDTGRT